MATAANGSTNSKMRKAPPKPRITAAKAALVTATERAAKPRKRQPASPQMSKWAGIAVSVVGAGVAAGYFAWRYYQDTMAEPDGFNAAFADGETDSENFEQTRNAGTSSMRSDPDDWEDIDDMSDASFPASDPPSFNPGTA